MPIEGQNVLTVSEITTHIAETLEHNFADVCVQGEISQLTRASSGHIYMTLKDDRAVLKAIIWRSRVRGIEFDLEEGLEVIGRGSVDVYPPRGSYQLLIRNIYPCGVGALQLAFRQLVKRLEKEGLFAREHKKTLPPFPEHIGIITSPSGAAVRDMIRILTRRWPIAELYLLPSPVQGQTAAGKIAEALRTLNEKRPQLDMIIVGRGGGSLEDLWAFNEEIVARAIFESSIPIVSAVGHEVDVSVSDLVADMRAATPSEAAEKAVPNRAELLSRTGLLAQRLGQALLSLVADGQQRLNSLVKRHIMRHPETLLQEKIQRTDDFLDDMRSAITRRVEQESRLIESLEARLKALSPKQVLDRGYSITFGPGGLPLRDCRDICVGDKIETLLQDGKMSSTVKEIVQNNENNQKRK